MKTTIRKVACFLMVLIVIVLATIPSTRQTVFAAVNGVFNNVTASGTINSDIGFRILSAAPLNHLPCGNGTNYVDSTSCLINVQSANVATALATLPTPCSTGQAPTGIDVNGNSVACASLGVTGTLSSGLGKSFATQYQNTSGHALLVTGSGITSGSGTSSIECRVGVSSASTRIWQGDTNATVGSGNAGFLCVVPTDWFYELNTFGAITGVSTWNETALN